MTTATAVTAYEFDDMGCDNSQYFPGVSTVYTEWDEVYVGVGDTAAEAAADALEMLAQSGEYDAESIDVPADMDTTPAHAECDGSDDGSDDGHDWQHYVALFVK